MEWTPSHDGDVLGSRSLEFWQFDPFNGRAIDSQAVSECAYDLYQSKAINVNA